MSKRGDEPAYPEAGMTGLPNGDFLYGRSGMTLREHYAGLAMQGYTANGANLSPRDVAHWALEYADALIAELESAK
jgi:hypothetical protein